MLNKHVKFCFQISSRFWEIKKPFVIFLTHSVHSQSCLKGMLETIVPLIRPSDLARSTVWFSLKRTNGYTVLIDWIFEGLSTCKLLSANLWLLPLVFHYMIQVLPVVKHCKSEKNRVYRKETSYQLESVQLGVWSRYL